ncbi:hypothetical protein D4764_08G0007830 [Takifugu flavidus]|uniref:Uncharacterized protein n=1 Tax=Takifugu flavidus TaxID=433684 RepID=A0A5C6MNW0_9TELE|nr:hypothetical protein D4764_08G0007830 [Takifugu flavidus]
MGREGRSNPGDSGSHSPKREREKERERGGACIQDRTVPEMDTGPGSRMELPRRCCRATGEGVLGVRTRGDRNARLRAREERGIYHWMNRFTPLRVARLRIALQEKVGPESAEHHTFSVWLSAEACSGGGCGVWREWLNV